eukprot:10179891-Alexandrium_andersonii.AAC.1
MGAIVVCACPAQASLEYSAVAVHTQRSFRWRVVRSLCMFRLRWDIVRSLRIPMAVFVGV